MLRTNTLHVFRQFGSNKRRTNCLKLCVGRFLSTSDEHSLKQEQQKPAECDLMDCIINIEIKIIGSITGSLQCRGDS